MAHPYFEYCDSHDRHRLRTQPERRARRTALFTALAAIMSFPLVRIAVRRLSA